MNHSQPMQLVVVGMLVCMFYVGDGKYVLEAQGYYNVSAPVSFKGEGPRMLKHEESKMIASFDANVVYFYLETL